MTDYSYKGHKICGVATNDLKQRNSSPCPTIYYQLWNSVVKRCHDPRVKGLQPNYANTTMCDEWLLLSKFKYWCEGYGLSEANKHFLQLDKDILSNENHYSPENCCFVPRYVNNVLVDRNATTGRVYPMGVTWDKDWGKYRASVSMQVNGVGKRSKLGGFKTALSAHKAYQKAKAEEIYSRIEWWKFESISKEFLLFNENVAAALCSRADKILQDMHNNIETFKI